MRLRNRAFLSLAIKRSDSPDARAPELAEPDVIQQKEGYENADDRQEEADADKLRLPPKNVGKNCAAQFQLFDSVLSLGDVLEIRSRQVACKEEVLGPTLGIARKEHHEQTEVDDQERQHHELDRQETWKVRVVIEDRTHHERNKQERDVRLQIARPYRIVMSGEQTAIELSRIGKGFVHPTFGRSHWGRRERPPKPALRMNPAPSNMKIA